jgi:hypothetical protein
MDLNLIPKGNDDATGLPKAVQQAGYYHNVEAKNIELYFRVFRVYPNGNKEEIRGLMPDGKHRFIIQDIEGKPEQVFVGNNDKTETIPATPSITTYTDYCNKYNAKQISDEFDQFLTAMPE